MSPLQKEVEKDDKIPEYVGFQELRKKSKKGGVNLTVPMYPVTRPRRTFIAPSTLLPTRRFPAMLVGDATRKRIFCVTSTKVFFFITPQPPPHQRRGTLRTSMFPAFRLATPVRCLLALGGTPLHPSLCIALHHQRRCLAGGNHPPWGPCGLRKPLCDRNNRLTN